jgi:hypothetical protein
MQPSSREKKTKREKEERGEWRKKITKKPHEQ